jgi:hypothetical protein
VLAPDTPKFFFASHIIVHAHVQLNIALFTYTNRIKNPPIITLIPARGTSKLITVNIEILMAVCIILFVIGVNSTNGSFKQ